MDILTQNIGGWKLIKKFIKILEKTKKNDKIIILIIICLENEDNVYIILKVSLYYKSHN